MKTKFTSVVYKGNASVDPRFTTPMLSWTLADIRKAKNNQKLSLGIEEGSIVCYDGDFERQLCHPLKHVVGVTTVPPVQNGKGHRGLVYLVRAPKDPLLHCHLFEAANSNDVSDLITQMRESKKTANSAGSLGSIPQHMATTPSDSAPYPGLNGTTGSYGKLNQMRNGKSDLQLNSHSTGRIRRMPSSVSCNSGLNEATKENDVIKAQSVNNLTSLCADISPSSSHFFEVLYVGKIKVSHKRVPDNFIDEALMKFRAYEAEKQRLRQLSGDSSGNLRRAGSRDSSTFSLDSQESITTQASNLLTTKLVSQSQVISSTDDEAERANSDGSGSSDKETSCKSNGDEGRVVLKNGRIKGTLQRGQSQDLIVMKSTSLMAQESVPGSIIKRARSASIGSISTPTIGNLSQLSKLSHVNQADQQNRTMVFQVGRFDLRLISPDRKQILLHKQLRDVSGCVQGINNADHFGFICRERPDSCYISYIFKCQSETVTDDVVLAISQAFIAGADQYKSKEKINNQIYSCDHCPMTWYHKLCLELEGLSDKKAQSTIFRRIEQHWSNEDQTMLLEKYNGAGDIHEQSFKEQNVFLMALVRMHCETKQQRHTHDTTENRTEFINQYLGGNTIFMKAKRSLSNSFDHLLKRKGSKDDFAASIREFNLNREANMLTSPTIDENCETPKIIRHGVNSAAKFNYRNSTKYLDYKNNELGLTPNKSMNSPVQLQSPMMDIFMKVGNTPRESEIRNEESWRQDIFNKVTTPRKRLADQTDPNSYIEVDEPYRKKTKEELRDLWQRAINQALLLVRMERENARLKARQEVHAVKRIKLEYNEIITCQKDMLDFWEKHTMHSLAKVDCDFLKSACKQGIPKAKRGEVWTLLAERQAEKWGEIDSGKFPNCNVSYQNLLQQLTSHQHAILIDLGRTFPSHAYFSSALGPGQLSLFNILKAYSLLDPDVGYCQGLSFIAGVLLLHMEEPDAFFLLRHLMLVRNMREKYLPTMSNLQLQLYQLSRLLKDRIPEIHDKFNEFDIAPTLYAAPWILTVFSSQFPLGFVTRVFDLLFLESSEIIFKFAIALLKINADKLLNCETFEEIMGCLKNNLPDLDANAMDKIMKHVLNMDISKQLLEYSVEYQVLQEENHCVNKQTETIRKLEETNRMLLKENEHLQSRLEISIMNEHSLENARNQHQIWHSKLESEIKSLEDKLNVLSKFISTQVELKSDCNFPPEIRRIMQQIDQRENQKKSEPVFTKKVNPLVKSKSMNSHLCDKRIELNLPLRSVDENQEVEIHNNNNLNKKFYDVSNNKINENNIISRNCNTNLKIDEKFLEDIDSGISTPQTPLDVKHENKTLDENKLNSCHNSSHPLGDCDVSFTYNGTTKLKTIRPLRANLSRTVSTDLLVEKDSC